MDFLPRPQHPLHPCPEITLLSLEQYDGEDFYTYPERQGWGPRTPRKWGECFANPNYKFIAMVERWILFGYLFTFFGKDTVKSTNFVEWKGNPPYPVLTMQELSRLFLKTSPSMNMLNFDLIYKIGMLNQGLIRTNVGIPFEDESSSTMPLDQFITEFRIEDVRSSYVSLLTSIIIEMGFETYFQLNNQQPAIGRQFTAVNIPETNMLYTEFRLNGWCPADLVTVFQRFNTSCFYFLLNMTNPQPAVDHLDPLSAEATGTRQAVQTTPLVPNGPAIERQVFGQDQDNLPRDEGRLCTPQRCKARVLDDATYKTKHATWDCRCDFVKADTSRLCGILQKESIPLIEVVDPDDGHAEITFNEAQPGTKYIAISHVWSDGLGNTSENAIPRCQLQRLSRYVQNITDSHGDYVYFWLDTICIPPDKICGCECSPIELCNPPCRGRALEMAQITSLGLMRKTYEDADAVLVLDSWILETTCEGKSHVETLLRIFTSSWTRRLWTYQEGFLAKVIHFQFLDRTLNIDDAIVELQESSDIIIRLTFLSPIMAGYWELRHSTQSHRLLRGRFWNFTIALPAITSQDLHTAEEVVGNDEGSWILESLYTQLSKMFSVPDDQPKQSDAAALAGRLITAVSAVYHRSTSVMTDEPLCLGALLGLDVGKLAVTEPQYRAERFWQMFQLVPKQLLFLSGPKVDAPNYRWAPLSLLRTNQPVLYYDENKSHLSLQWDRDPESIRRLETGRLVIHTKGFILPLGSKIICTFLLLRLPDSNTICCIRPERSDACDPNIDFTKGIRAKDDYGCEELAILTKSADSKVTGTSNCILVAIQKTSDDGVYCRRICTINLTAISLGSRFATQAGLVEETVEQLSLDSPEGCLDRFGVLVALVLKEVKTVDWYVG
ncbi:hypothetical protein FAUST_8049 [Fusarium austroamericanum]|uniref:Heterokaryon incompatibility domain-containing protein n=1 Tax=Fusarium austroamericanum TaxID=282268 RepID=A0AAN6BXW2_FUSAU|nr:hypothetical protein FAUST_8049 [Fusarium austroamericanum]